jgi:cytosine/adenosine deaminase-related metal-dependent hydrolase
VRVSVHIGAADFGPRHHAVRRLAESGRLGEDLCMVHVSSTPADELALIADHGVHVSLGPWTEQVVDGAGGCPVTALTAAGIRPALSGDTETSGSGDMFTQMRALLLAARSTEGGPQAPVEAAYGQLDALHCATTAGAAALGMTHRIGSLSPGKQADIVLIRTTDVNLAPVHDPVGAVVLAAHPGNVDTVIVAGRIRKRAGQLLAADLGHLVERAAASAERLLAAADVPAIVAPREPR